MSARAYPLHWPAGRPRKEAGTRRSSPFGNGKRPTVARSVSEVITELKRWGVKQHELTISTNITLGAENAGDPGVAIYFRRKGRDHVVACDAWDRVGCNLWACARTLDAFRMFDRYGVQTGEEVLSAFAALPEASVAAQGMRWHEVLGCRVDANLEEAQQAFRDRAMTAHPDKGGSPEQWQRLATAWDQGRAVILKGEGQIA